jgi:hypothetical protein
MGALEHNEDGATHVVMRTIASGLWTTERRYGLAEGTALRLIEVAQHLEGTCAGPFLSSVGRYEVLDGAPGEVAEITHGTINDDKGPAISDHPDVERLGSSRP